MSAYSQVVSPVATRTLSTAEERRETVLRAALPLFAERGLHGTPTADVARAAGISQAYLFRLFPTKGELYVAVVERCFARTHETFRLAAERARAEGEEVLPAMGRAYVDLLEDRDLLLNDLHAHAAAATDAEVRAVVRRGFAELHALVARLSGAGEDEVRSFFAHGMLLNVLAAMDAHAVDAPWARALVGPARDC